MVGNRHKDLDRLIDGSATCMGRGLWKCSWIVESRLGGRSSSSGGFFGRSSSSSSSWGRSSTFGSRYTGATGRYASYRAPVSRSYVSGYGRLVSESGGPHHGNQEQQLGGLRARPGGRPPARLQPGQGGRRRLRRIRLRSQLRPIRPGRGGILRMVRGRWSRDGQTHILLS